MKKPCILFVYGTLRKGFYNHFLLESGTFLGTAGTREKYALFVDGIPYVSKGLAVSRILGEAYEVDEETLAWVDELEGHPDWYRREMVEVALEDGTGLLAWIYFNESPSGMLVESGDYTDSRDAEDHGVRRGEDHV